MTYSLSYSDQVSLGMIVPDDIEPLTHCSGPAYPDSHGCGCFLAAGDTMCERCRDESEAYWREDIARMAQLDAEFDAVEAAYYNSPTYAAEIAMWEEYMDECEASGPLDNSDVPF